MRKRGLIGSIRLFIYIPPPDLCSVYVLWSEGQRALWCLSGRGWEEMSPLGWPAAGSGGAAGRLQVRVGAAQAEEAAEGGRMSSKSKTTLYPVFCGLEKAYFFQMLLILAHVQLDRCSRSQIWVSVKEDFVWILASPRMTTNSSLPPWFADTWSLCFIYCARPAICIPRPCTKEVTLLLDCR